MDAQTEAITFAIDNQLDYAKLREAAMVMMSTSEAVAIMEYEGDRFAAEFLKQSPAMFLHLAQMQVARAKAMESISGALKAGNPIEAFKVTRHYWGLGLRDAKDVIMYVCKELAAMGKLSNAEAFLQPSKEGLLWNHTTGGLLPSRSWAPEDMTSVNLDIAEAIIKEFS